MKGDETSQTFGHLWATAWRRSLHALTTMAETIPVLSEFQRHEKHFQLFEPKERNQRSAFRYELCARVECCWIDPSRITRHGQGRTRDISTRGCYVLGMISPPVGTLIAMNIDIPFKTAGVRILRIQTEGHVVRVELPRYEGEQAGFSVRNDRVTTYRV